MTDLNDDEADYLITVYDPISLMAGIDAQALASLAQQFADRREVIEILDGLTDIEALLGLGEEQPDGGGDEGEDADTETLHQQLQAKWGTELDQVWEIPSKSAPGQVHRVVCGDSMDAKNIRTACGGQPARCMWSDPPYGVNYEGKTQDALTIENDGAEDLPDLLRRAFAVADASLQDGSAIYIAHPAGQLSITFGLAFLEAGWHLHETLVWVKDSMVLGHSDYHYKHEPIHYGWKGKNRRWYGERDKVSVFEIPRPKRSTLHPTMKPPELIVPQLRNSTKMLDLVLDPFLGSGSTIVACEQSGRVGCGTELDPKYVAVILERLQGLGLEPRLVNG